MAFAQTLEKIVTTVDGAIACSVMGFDGIAVDTHQGKPQVADELDLQAALVEFSNVLSQLKSTAETLKTGKVAELSVNTEKLITLMRMVTPEYFVVLALLPTGNYGKARYSLRIHAPLLAADL